MHMCHSNTLDEFTKISCCYNGLDQHNFNVRHYKVSLYILKSLNMIVIQSIALPLNYERHPTNNHVCEHDHHPNNNHVCEHDHHQINNHV